MIGMRKFFNIFILLGLFCLMPIQTAWAVSVQEIVDAILGQKTFSGSELQEMDLNKDGKVDVADLVTSPPQRKKYVGTMSFDPDAILAPQTVELRLAEGDSLAEFDVKDSPLFPEPFTMSVLTSGDTVRFTSAGNGSFAANDARNPLDRPISWTLTITDSALDGEIIRARFRMTYTGFKPDSGELEVNGTLYLKDQIDSEGLSFENANNMDLLVQKYGTE